MHDLEPKTQMSQDVFYKSEGPYTDSGKHIVHQVQEWSTD